MYFRFYAIGEMNAKISGYRHTKKKSMSGSG